MPPMQVVRVPDTKESIWFLYAGKTGIQEAVQQGAYKRLCTLSMLAGQGCREWVGYNTAQIHYLPSPPSKVGKKVDSRITKPETEFSGLKAGWEQDLKLRWARPARLLHDLPSLKTSL